MAFKLTAAEPELKGSPAELATYLAGLPKTVLVSGEAEMKVQADRAMLILRVTTEHKSLEETLRANQEVRAKIISSLKERGLPPDRVQASKFSSTPRESIFKEKKSYRVENILKVKVLDEKEFQAVGHVVDTMAEVHYLTVELEHSDKETFRSKALTQALDNASERKRVFEERLGIKLVPKSFSQTMAQPRETRPYITGSYSTDLVGAQGGSAPSRLTRLPAGDGANVIEESGSLFGEMVFTARVTVEYSVESK
jgi:uncharacterized protein YggE